MSDVLVEHNTIEDHAVFEDTTWDLLDLGVSLDIDLNVVGSILVVDSSDSLDSKVANEVSPLAGELGSNGGVDNLLEVIVGLEVDWFLFNKIINEYIFQIWRINSKRIGLEEYLHRVRW